MYNVKFLPKAEDEMYELALYIANEFSNVDAAEKLIDKIMKVRDNLKLFPTAHAVFKVIKSIKIRRAVVLNCSIFYVIDKESSLVTIINVKHNSNDFMNNDTFDDLLD